MPVDHRSASYGAALGFLADLLVGDPRHGHPVAAFGRAATGVERQLWRDRRVAGVAHTALCLGGVLLAASGLARAATDLSRRAHDDAVAQDAVAQKATWSRRGWQAVATPVRTALPTALTAATTWVTLGGTSLAREARAIARALEAGEVDTARRRLPHLCGRDAAALTPEDLARAVVESVAENTSDATVGALVWGALAGVPGLAGFRAVNTLDAMVGHRSPRYRRFGWAAARLDDVVGWPGSRLTAVLAVLSGPRPRNAWRVWCDDGPRHPSPNAGPVEAAFAGALDVQLGGRLSYAGRTDPRPVLNPTGRAAGAADIERAVRLSRRVSALALTLCVAGRLAAGRLADRRAANGVATRPAGPGRPVRSGVRR